MGKRSVKRVMLPLEDLQLLEEIEEQMDICDAVAALKEAEIHGTISLEKFKIAQGHA